MPAASSQQPELLADPALIIKIKVDWGELNNWDIIVTSLLSRVMLGHSTSSSSTPTYLIFNP